MDSEQAAERAAARLAGLGRRVADPRGWTVGIFLDLRNVFPVEYPLPNLTIERLLELEGRIARTIDYGLILPKLTALYRFSAESLGEPRLAELVTTICSATDRRVSTGACFGRMR